MMGFVFGVCLFFVHLSSFAESGISDEVLDREVRPANFTMYELSPVEMAQYLLDDERFALVEKVRPSVVELSSDPYHSGSGVIVGYNGKNQPLILTAGHLIHYEQRDLSVIRQVSLDHARGRRDGSIVDEKNHVVRPNKNPVGSNTGKGWYGLPVFHPSFTVNDSLILIDQKMDFGYYVMTGRTVDFSPGESNLEERYTVRESLNAGFEAPIAPLLRTANAKADTEVLMMGRTHHLTYEDQGAEEPLRKIKYQMSYSFGDVLSLSDTMKISKKYALDLSYKKQFFVRGDVDKGMAGAGVFNQQGELVGIVTKVIRDSRKARKDNPMDMMDRTRIKIIGAVVLRIETILEQTALLSKQPELLEMVNEAKAVYKVGSCHRLFSK